jgi:hypothetical protein
VSAGWKLVIDEAPFEFFVSRRASERRFLLKAFERLKSEPYQTADYFAKDDSDRPLSLKGFQPFLITYWLDQAVKEVRVLDIKRIYF